LDTLWTDSSHQKGPGAFLGGSPWAPNGGTSGHPVTIFLRHYAWGLRKVRHYLGSRTRVSEIATNTLCGMSHLKCGGEFLRAETPPC